ncbi:reprolysin-like metallopeptidase [Flavobacterium channae]|uniref:reprolysin-like metallopeptidase n=1 Tax=Flavobacterium channae TaxID=2897181 RepID=UPI001E2AD8E6|nr:zinc-dependent metalloprotease family protein [Flavobacterium channae]UGS23822.1 M12 family metallo-peptidase [Flavobacterium channae]
MKRRILIFSFLLINLLASAQKSGAWKEVENSFEFTQTKLRREVLPVQYKLYSFDYEKFKAQLVNVPVREEFTGVSNVVVSFPMPNGAIEEFRIIEASTFEKSLQNQFPEIRSFAGQGVTNPSNVIRFSVSPYNGVSALIRSGSEGTTFIIDPISMDYKTVIVFDRVHTKKSGDFICTTEDAVQQFGQVFDRNADNNTVLNADDSTLRRFRMAQSCTGEYANYFGATSAAQVNLVLAAFNATYTRVNAIFEMDFNATMVLIANTTNVIYYNPSTDPYSASTNMDPWNLQLMNTLSSEIGNANFDIGHLFGASGGGGNAGCIGCVCSNDQTTTTYAGDPQVYPVAYKGSGYTSPANGIPMGDDFDVDYVAHEIGHQLGGNHTFSMSTENNAVNMEPGSGVTIMGYAGITGATDVAAHSIPIFHAGSIQQITNNIKGKSCPTLINTGNAVPVPSAPATKTLPRGTAFKLTGTATDANAGDVLSYCWEQVDDATTVGAAASYPTETKTNGANFRSFMPKNNGTRYFPRLEDHVKNGVTGNQWEIIPNNPSANRTLNFRMTVRDNKPGGGNNESVNTAVTFDRTKGPFLITSQNTAGISYTQGSTQTITWSVNNTNTMTGASNVNIKLSTDGGQTFPIVLAGNTPNDGNQVITIPNVSAPYCRILIEPTGNDFYAINTNDFAIGYTVTTNTTCNQYSFTPNLAIPDGQASGGYGTVVGFNANIPMTGTISDVNILDLNLTHTYMSDITLILNHPDGTQLLYIDDVCSNRNGFNNTDLDSQATNTINCGTNTNSVIGAGPFQPSSSFNIFNGKQANGTWQFLAADYFQGDTGTLNSLVLEVCTSDTTITEAPNACGVITTTWNGSTWSNGVPLKNVVAIFNGNYSSTADLEACSVVVNSGFNVVFNPGHTLIVGNEVTVNGTGTLTIENNAALRQINDQAVNVGNITVKRNSTPMIRLDYTAWSSPVSGQNLKAFSPNTLDNRFYEYLYTGTTTPTAYQSVANVASTNFAKAKGYMIRAANDWPATPATFNGQFYGVPHNGNASISLGIGYNLLGNPYASPISADRFLRDNETIVGALYFWTHQAAAVGGVYPVNNYASYTTLGGTAAAAGGPVPNGTIQTGQGFYVRAYDFGSALFSNNQRVNASVSTQFYRTSNEEEPVVEKHRVWLNLNDSNVSYSQTLIGYMDGASAGFDNIIDARILDDSKTMLYSISNDDKLVIQGKGMPFTNDDVVPLGLKVLAPGSYTISLENLDGLFVDQNVYLKDNFTNTIHDIKQSAYSFTTQDGTFENRFSVVYNNSVLGNDDFINENVLTVYSNQNGIVINTTEKISEVVVFDVLGRKLHYQNGLDNSEVVISKIVKSNQALLVKTTLSNGQVITKKIIF